MQNEAEIMDWPNSPSMPGMGLDDEKAEALTDLFRDRLLIEPIVSSDMGRYDWTVQEWDLEADILSRMSLAQVRDDTPLARLMYNRYLCLSLSVFSTSGGRMYAQTFRGVMKSGCYITSSGDSRIRTLNAQLVGASWSVSMGDDAVESNSLDKEGRYKAIGKRLKVARVISDSENFEVDFCSHWFKCRGGKYAGVIPTHPEKSLVRLLSQSDLSIDLVSQYVYFVRHIRGQGGIVRLLRELHSLGCFEGMKLQGQIEELDEVVDNVLGIVSSQGYDSLRLPPSSGGGLSD
jgi:hypothetical protein